MRYNIGMASDQKHLWNTLHQLDNDGHIRHFFSETYVSECVRSEYKIEKLANGNDRFYNRPSAFIKVIARKI